MSSSLVLKTGLRLDISVQVQAMMDTGIYILSMLAVFFAAICTWLLVSRNRLEQRLEDKDKTIDAAHRQMRQLKTHYQAEVQSHQETGQKIRRYLQLMDTLINAIPNPIYFNSSDGVFKGCNTAFSTDVLGLAREHIIGCRAEDLVGRIPQKLVDCLVTSDRKMSRNQRVDTFERNVACVNGYQRDFVFYTAPVLDTAGQMTGSIGIMLDSTEKNRTTQEYIEKEKFQGVLETAGAVCHELNQPLQILSGYAELILAETSSGDCHADAIDKIQAQVERMADITRKLQRITRYETVAYGEHCQIIDIHKASQP